MDLLWAQSFRLTASYFLLLAQKKVTKENGLPRDVNNAQGLCGAVTMFGIGLPGLGPKTAGIHAGRPPGADCKGE